MDVGTLHRFPVRSPSEAEPKSPRDLDLPSLLGATVFWIASVARVSVAVLTGETFGTEATLALLTVAVLPFLAFPSVVSMLNSIQRKSRR